MNRDDIVKMGQLYQSVLEKSKKLDPVGKADADIDNDGDVDSTDGYLKNRRKEIGKDIKKDGGKSEMKDKKECCNECKCSPCECESNVAEDTADKIHAHVSGVKEDIDTSITDSLDHLTELVEKAGAKKHHSTASAYKAMWEAANADRTKHYKGATKPEEWIENESGKSKEFVKLHSKKTEIDDETDDYSDVFGKQKANQSPTRRGDTRTGDKVAQKPKDTSKNG
jgi:hypothetical protein